MEILGLIEPQTKAQAGFEVKILTTLPSVGTNYFSVVVAIKKEHGTVAGIPCYLLLGDYLLLRS